MGMAHGYVFHNNTMASTKCLTSKMFDEHLLVTRSKHNVPGYMYMSNIVLYFIYFRRHFRSLLFIKLSNDFGENQSHPKEYKWEFKNLEFNFLRMHFLCCGRLVKTFTSKKNMYKRMDLLLKKKYEVYITLYYINYSSWYETKTIIFKCARIICLEWKH